jgi:L-alanine-DL-glutamate epimerase-like enolase superfamily enzyme
MGACDYFNIKLAKSGGLHTALKVNAIAERAGIRCMVGCMAESRLGLSASAHLAAARPNIAFIDLDSALVHRQDPVRGGIRYGEGLEIILPEAPGLGADVDEAFLAGLDHVSV